MIPLLLYSQLVDLVTFLFAESAIGFEGEYGVLANVIYDAAGVFGIAVLKVVLVLLITIIVWAFYQLPRTRWLAHFGAAVGIFIGTAGMLTNVASLAVSV